MNSADLFGSIGVMLMLMAFMLNIADKLSNDSPLYICLNIIGGAMACYSSIIIKFVPFVVLEGTWTMISIWALYIYFKRDFRK